MLRTSLSVSILAVAFVLPVSPLSAQRASSSSAAPDPCALFTKAELQQLTGHADVMRMRNMPDTLGSGAKVCTIDGGGTGARQIDIEVILYARTANARMTVPTGAEAVTGIGESAYYQQTPGNAAAYAVNGAHALRIGLQSDTPQNLRTVALALLKAGVAKLK